MTHYGILKGLSAAWMWLLMTLFAFGFKLQEMETAGSIIDKVQEKNRVSTEISLVKMSTFDNQGNVSQKKILSIIRLDEADDYSYFIRFLEPGDVKGVNLLTIERAGQESKQYLYLPAMPPQMRLKQVEGSGKSGYFMGTDFTFEDLRKEKGVEYVYTRQFDDVVQGKECFVLLSTPADSRKMDTSGYGNRMLYIEKKTYNVLKIEYFSPDQTLLKTFEAFDYDSVEVDGPTMRPRRAVMTNHEKGSTSVMILLKSRLNYNVDPNVFTIEALKTWDEEWDQAYLSVFDNPQAK